ncbi:protein Skeletor, isoforms B/C [Eurytemora carolleeae]|uniref:protein Skeletor, isoforms B/C n=1 Tax=Eurytemora carolleeae TaxID=1294199 RepID=UPI000C77B4C4|nr:protein Skeletor, isoforms B/C [Eurytemora carolleeae]|eukprot:XP_023345279.1 protein Skeletor, isoforms B/C-like [Eurytemora affinis]
MMPAEGSTVLLLLLYSASCTPYSAHQSSSEMSLLGSNAQFDITENLEDEAFIYLYDNYIEQYEKDVDYLNMEDIVYPTLGREDLNLTVETGGIGASSAQALSITEVGDFSRNFGTYIGDIKSHAHRTRGHVYAVDKNHLFIRKFSYDGGGSLDAYFWVGSDQQPSPRGQVVPYPPHEGFDRLTGKPLPIPEMKGVNILLPLPPRRTTGIPMDITEIKWLSVWCTRFTVNFAHIFLPTDPRIPRRMHVHAFLRLFAPSQISSDIVQLLDDKTIYIPNFFLTVGNNRGYKFKGSRRKTPEKFEIEVPNENNRLDDLRDYNGRDVTLILNGKASFYSIRYIAVYDDINGQVLGQVEIPTPEELESHPLPPALGQNQQWWPEQVPPPSTPSSPRHTTSRYDDNVGPSYMTPPPTPVKLYELPNCREFLGRRIRVQWQSDSDKIYFRVQAKTKETDFAALGFVDPRSRAGLSGIEADIVKIFMNNSNSMFSSGSSSSSSSSPPTFTVVDSFLSSSSQCTLRAGLCADRDHGSHDNVILVDYLRQADISTVDFIKPRQALDRHDTTISDDSHTEVVVGIGTLRAATRAWQENYENEFNMENGTIDFNSKEAQSCLEYTSPKADGGLKWKVPFKLRSGIQNFEVRLGPTGGSRGYKAITGEEPPFIELCWWINGVIMPELHVYRGETYYFKVQGGDSDRLGLANFHPFYITSDKAGGFNKKQDHEKAGEKIFAGVEDPYGFNPLPTAKGALCYWQSKQGQDRWRESRTFKEYQSTLEVICEGGSESQYGLLNWTVTEDTPDLVYYQSYTHEGLGWKINVRDSNSSFSLQGSVILILILSLSSLVSE